MKPQTPGRGIFYALMMEETGKSYLVARACILKFSGSGQVRGLERIQHTQFFRAQAGSCSIAYTESSKIQGPGRICILKFSGPGQVPGCWRIQTSSKSQGPGQNLYTQKFRARTGSGSIAYTESPKNLYTQIFRARAGSWPGAYTACSKNLDPGRTSILKNSEPRQVPGR